MPLAPWPFAPCLYFYLKNCIFIEFKKLKGRTETYEKPFTREFLRKIGLNLFLEKFYHLSSHKVNLNFIQNNKEVYVKSLYGLTFLSRHSPTISHSLLAFF